MAILRHDTVMRNADGQTMSTMVTTANIGTYAVASNATYYIGTTQNVFNRASGAQTLTGVSIDGNAATVTNGVYTTGAQTIGGTKTFSDGVVVNGATYYTFNKPTTNAYQTVALFGSAGAGLFLTTDSAIIGVGAYYNNGWIATATSGRQIDFAGGNFTFGAFSGATVGGAAGWGTVATLSSAGSFVATGDVRTIIFYDSNNTAYYCDPASTSNLVGLTVANTITGSISGNAATATTSLRSTIEDTRAAQRTPNDYDDYRASYEFTNAITGLGDWHSAFTLQGWHNGYAAWQIIGPASTSAHENFYLRSGVNTTWNSVRAILHSGNYNSYAPTLTGTGASGSWGISVTGNAATATILQTARNINGTSFNGSAAITTASWGTARTLTIGSTGKSVDGSAAVAWSLAEIGAAAIAQTMFIGTTSIAINRASASQTLTGVSIDGNAATATNGLTTSNYVNYSAFTSSLTSTVDARAPIFYDSNDTTYYLDPANTSLSLKTRGYITINNATAPNNLAMLNIGSSGSGETRAIDISGGWSGNENKSITFTHATGSTNIVAQINAQHNGPGSKLRWGKLYHSGDSSTYTMELISESTTSAYLTVAGSVRSPIFYDSDNTSYYINAAGASSLNTLTMAGIITTVSSGTAINFSGQSDSFGYNATSGQGTYIKGTGATYIYGGGVFFDGSAIRTLLHSNNYSGYSTFSGSVTSTYGNFTTPGLIMGDAQYGFYVASGNVYYKSASGGSHYWRNIANSANVVSFDNSGNIINSGYINATSYIYTSTYFQTGGNLIYPSGYGATQTLQVSNSANNAWIAGISIAPGGLVTMFGDARAPIFYDSGNTAYYIDAASTSNLNALIVAASTRIGGAASRSTSGLTVGFTDNSTFAANTDVGDTDRMLSIVNESSTTNAMAVLGFRVNPNGGTANAMLDIKFVQTGATNTSALHYTFNHGGSFADRFSILSSGNVGIGTISPTQVLDVRGNIKLGADSAGNYVYYVKDNEGSIIRTTRTDVTQEGLFRSDGWGNFTFNNNIGVGLSLGTGYGVGSVGTGIVYANGSVRAPIFYDSNNTAFYTDPASTSVLNRLTIDGGNYAFDYFQSLSDFTSGTLVTTDIPATAAEGESFVMNVVGKSYSGSTSPFNFSVQGYLYSSTIINFSGLSLDSTALSTVKIFENGGVLCFWWPTITYWNAFEVSVRAYNSAKNNYNRVTNITNSTEPTGTKKVTVTLQRFMRADVSATNSVDLRAPIFYDSNDTTYYTDPSSLSNILELKTNKNWYDSSASAWGGGINMGGNNPSIGFQSTASTWWYMLHHSSSNINFYRRSTSGSWNHDGIWDSSGNLIWQGSSVRAPIFYDQNNTAYYLDAASTSNLVGLTVANTITGSITGNAGGSSASCTGNAATATILQTARNINGTSFNGSAAITTATWGTARTLTIGSTGKSVDGSAGVSWSLAEIGALPLSGGQITGNTTFSADNHLTFGPNSSWGSSIRIGGNGYTATGTETASVVTTDGNLHLDAAKSTNGIYLNWYGGTSGVFFGNGSSGQVAFVSNTGNASFSGVVDATQFRDASNTGYYVDPASTSNLYDLTLTGSKHTYLYINPGNGYEAMVRYNGGAGSGWYVGKRITNQLVTTSDFHFYSEAAGATVGGIDTSGNIYSIGSVRSPIFYDSDNTAYYINAASTSSLNALNLADYVDVGTYIYLRNNLRMLNSAGNGWLETIVRNSGSPYFTNPIDGGTFLASDGAENNNWLFQENARGWGLFYFNRGTQSGQTFGSYTTVGAETFIIGQGSGTTMTSTWTGYNASSKVAIMLSNYTGYIWANDTIFSATGLRAPIFYDSDDTSFYANPAGESKFNYLRLTNNNALYFTTTGVAELNNEGNSTNVAFRMIKSGSSNADGNNYGVLNLQRTNHTNGATNAGASIFFELKDSGGTIREYAGLSGCKTEAGAAGGRLIFHRYARTEIGYWDADQLFANASMRSPIFYDSDNTGYYLNPAGLSQLSAVYANDWFRAQGNTGLYFQDKGYGITSAEAASNTYGNASTYGTGRNSWQGWGIGSRHCLMSNGGDNIGIHDNNRSWLYYWDGTYHRFQYGYFEAAGSVRGPIFYDSDNTGYYIDAAGASSINTVTSAQYYTTGWFRNNSSGNGLYNEATTQHFYSDSANYWNVASSASAQGIRFRTGGHNGTVRGYIYADTSNSIGLLDQNGNWRARVVDGDYFLAEGSSIRGQIFYDSSDTNYYCDPNGTSSLAAVNANAYYPHGGVTESDIYARSLSINAYHHGDSLTYDTFQFNAASVYETRATVGSSFVSSTVETSIFRGDRFGGMTIANNVYQVRWTWNNTIGYKFFKTLYIANSTNGNSFTVTIESSANGSTWTTIATTGAMSNWPGHSWYNYFWNNNATQGYIRITVTPTWVNANTMDIYSMRYFCSYSLDAGARLYDWDYNRNVTFPAFVDATQFRDTNNTAYYIDAASTSNLVGLTVANTITGSVSGNAVTAGGLSVHSGRNNEVNKIVRTDSNGYIQAGWINTTSGDNGTTAIDRVYASSDGFIRYYTPANFRTVLDVPTRAGSGASGSWGISVTGSSASCTGNAATVTNGVYTNTGNTLTGVNYFQSNLGTTSGTLNTPPLQAYATGTNAAFMSFHRAGSYAVNMGLDSDNVLRIGGWSAPANRLQLDMSGNLTVAGAMYGTNFIDSDNTAYFCNPASTSNLVGLTVANTITGNISGTAGSISGFNNPVTSATANTIVYRDGSGNITGNQIFGNYHNSSDDTSSSGITFIMAKFGDNYHRSASAAKVATFISGQTMNIAGSSTSCSGNAASVTDGVYLSTTQTISGVKTFSSAPIATNIAKAWVHFNGTGTIAVNASHNVASLTDNGVGDYTVNFTNAMVDANYAVAGTVTIDYTSAQSLNQLVLAVPRQTNAQVAGSCRLVCEYIHGAQLYDAVAVRAVFFR